MTVPPSGARNRRGGRKPGWQLLTALLVLAILASATLVFTNRVEFLRLAVILSLWAAVLGAFVTVTYRRQSEADQARARDMKFVYDLQLDREIAARREYEMSVEAHLRRQLAHEVRAQSADELAALRTELASLRGHLEAILGTDLGHRPALESERLAEQLAMPAAPGRVESSRVTIVEEVSVETLELENPSETTVVEEIVVVEEAHEVAEQAAEPQIIDVPEEPVTAPPEKPAGTKSGSKPRGSHRRRDEGQTPPQPPQPPRGAEFQQPLPPWRPPQPPPGAPWRPPEAEPRRGRHVPPEPAADSAALRAKHRVDPAEQAPEPAPEEAPGQHTGGQSVADLMARLQVSNPSGGGGRRRRED